MKPDAADALTPAGPGARQVARRLVARASHGDGAAGGAAAAQAACEQVYGELSRWVGAFGSRAIFARTLAQVRGDYPLLAAIQLETAPQARIIGVSDAVQEHGETTVEAALASLLVASLELLARLVGDDLAERLVDQSSPYARPDAENDRAEA